MHKYLTNLNMYSSTPTTTRDHDGDFDESLDPLREMVLEFFAIHRVAFREFPGHLVVLTRDSEYAVDFAEKLMGMLK
jgi:hypothetical protein